MPIDRHLNIVLPVDTHLGEIWVHSTPLSRHVFERYFLVMGRAFAMTFQVGGGLVSGPKIAALSLKEAATQMQVWEGPAGVEKGLIPEIHRMTNVIAPGDNGWQQMPLTDARDAGILDDDDFAEVEGLIVFFMLSSAMQQREALRVTLNGLTSLWGVQTTSSNSTEWAASLLISTKAATSGETPRKASSVPY